jgi:hypothetical protein
LQEVLASVCEPLDRFNRSSTVDLPWKLVAGNCRSLHSGEKIAAFHSFVSAQVEAGKPAPKVVNNP